MIECLNAGGFQEATEEPALEVPVVLVVMAAEEVSVVLVELALAAMVEQLVVLVDTKEELVEPVVTVSS